jgi:3-oxoacyl-[acyl-carrier protein] reductase
VSEGAGPPGRGVERGSRRSAAGTGDGGSGDEGPPAGGAHQSASAGGPSLAGRVAFVTGASGGIGRAIALAAARAGADVALTYRASEGAAREVAGEIERLGRRATTYRLDLAAADQGALAELGRQVADRFGAVDAWVNNAGADILTGAGAKLSTVDKLDLLLRVDLRGSMLASWAAAELMHAQPRGGVILNMSWDHVTFGLEGSNPQMFSAVKGGVYSFSKSLARSVAPRVRVNILAPGWIETAFGAGVDRKYYQEVVEQTPLARWGTPEDVARAAVWLMSDDAAFLTGQVVMVNGGVIM